MVVAYITALFVMATLFFPIVIKAAPSNPTGGGVYSPETVSMNTQVQTYLFGNWLQACFVQSSQVLTLDKINSYEWFAKGNKSLGVVAVNGTQGSSASCDDTNLVRAAANALSLGQPYDVLCELGYMTYAVSASDIKPCKGIPISSMPQTGGALVPNDGRSAANNNYERLSITSYRIFTPFWGEANAPAFTDAMKYWLFYKTAIIGCNLVEVPAGTADPLGAIKTLQVVDGKGAVTTKSYKPEGKAWADNIDTYVKAGNDPSGAFDDVAPTCKDLVDWANQSQNVQGYRAWAKEHPELAASDTVSLAQNPSGAGGPAGDGCPLQPGTMRWLGCAVFGALKEVADKLAITLSGFLYTPTSIFDDKVAQDASRTFRNFGMGLLLLVGLVMVIAQASGSELFDAYTIRKTLPRLGIAVVGMALAWPILRFVVSLTNDLGGSIYAIFMQIVGETGARGAPVGAGSGLVAVLGGLVGGTGFLIYLGFLGVMGTLSLLGTIVMALLLGLFVLSIRQLVVLMCIIMAPLAIAAYVLPGTQKLWKFWKNTFLTTLFMYPLIMGFIGAGAAMSYLLGGTKTGTEQGSMQLLAIIVYFAPYFMLPFSFKLAGGLMGTIFSLTNDKSRGLFDRARKYRKETSERRKGRLADGTLGGKFAQRTLGTTARMSTLKDQNFLTKTGRARFQRESKNLIDATAKERAAKAPQAVAGDTDANLVGMQARNRDDFSQKYLAHRKLNGDKRSEKEILAEANQKMAKLEGGYRAPVGSRAFRRAAAVGHIVHDNATWDNIAGERRTSESEADYYRRQRQAKETVVRQLGQDGIFEADEFAGLERENKNRPDNIAGSFGEHGDYISKVMEGKSVDTRGVESNMYKEVVASGATTGNKRAVKRIASQMEERLVASATGNNAAYGSHTTGDPATGTTDTNPNLMGGGGLDTWAAEYAAAADIHEAQTYSGQGNAEQYAAVMKKKAFDASDVAQMPPAIQTEAKKLLDAATKAGDTVTHQDVKNFLEGNPVGFTSTSGAVFMADPPSSQAVKAFSARKKTWGTGYQAQQGFAGNPQIPGQGTLPGL